MESGSEAGHPILGFLLETEPRSQILDGFLGLIGGEVGDFDGVVVWKNDGREGDFFAFEESADSVEYVF